MSVNNVIIDTAGGDGFTTAQVHGPPRFSAPFDGDNTNYILEQDYVISLASFSSTALNTVSPVYADYYLVSESQLVPTGAYDIVKWTRTYAKVPATRNDYSTFAYRFIGYAGNLGVLNLTTQLQALGYSGYVPGRNPFTLTVPLKIVNDYFMVGTGGTYANADLIPVNLAQKYYLSVGLLTQTNTGGMWVGTFTPRFPPVGGPTDIANGIPTDFLTDSNTGDPDFFVPVPSNPTLTAYKVLVSAGSSIVVEDSSISRWHGNIFCRVTKTVVAK